jgi:hypothetical protein
MLKEVRHYHNSHKQEILPEYMKNNVTNLLELRNTIYAAAVATMRMSGSKIKNNPYYLQN